MPDPLDRAVDARIDAYRPDTVPPFEAIETRKRARDRWRMAVGTGALSVAALAGAGLVVPALNGGGDRLTPGGPSEVTAVTRFAVQYATSNPVEGRSDGADAALVRCLQLPGATGQAGAKLSDPIVWVVTVDGTPQQSTAVRDCLAALPDAKVETLPDDNTTEALTRTFRVSNDGSASPDVYTVAVEKCLALPGVTGSSVQESYPATYEMRASGAAATALAECLAAAPGADVLPLDDQSSAAAGETAVWEVDPARPPRADALVIAAMVSRLACASGETGEVYAPSVVEKDDEVVVTFTVAPLREGVALCPANKPVPYSVTLDRPLGDRVLLDGACERKDAKTTSWCLIPQRWPTTR